MATTDPFDIFPEKISPAEEQPKIVASGKADCIFALTSSGANLVEAK